MERYARGTSSRSRSTPVPDGVGGSGGDAGPSLPHLPALDGLRGVAVLAVLLFHSGVNQARGGHLGVTLFFVLSGFLITTRLLFEHARSGRVDLRRFWVRRVRRLAPAALIGFVLAAGYLFSGAAVGGRRAADPVGDGVAALFSVANWRFVLDGASYGDTVDGPSPFQHYWSLSIEEQFYLGLPLVVALALGWAGRRRIGRWALGLGALAGVGLSTVMAMSLHGPGMPPLRAYYGTDARIAEPLVGVLLALLLAGPLGLRVARGVARRWLATAGVAAGAALTVLAMRLAPHEPSLYDGGLLAAALLSAVVIAASIGDGPLLRGLSIAPLQWLGRISYGVYVYHWPIFLWLNEQSTGRDGLSLFYLRAFATVVLAVLSYELVEQPIRNGALPRPVGLLGWANGAVAGLALVVLAATLAPTGSSVFLGADVAAAAAAPPIPTSPAEVRGQAPSSAQRRGGGSGGGHDGAAPQTSTDAAGAGPAASPASTTTTVPQERHRSAAGTRVAVVGDSLAANLGDGLHRWAEDRGDVAVYNLAIRGCPLSRGGIRRWPSRSPEPVDSICAWWQDPSADRSKALLDFDPHVIIIEDAINEIPDRYRDEWRRYVRPQEPVFARWLTEEYRIALSQFRSRGARIVVLNAPCVNWTRYGFGWETEVDADSRVLSMNQSVYTGQNLSDATIADLHSQICPNGSYSEEVEGDPNGRPDGLHLSETAAYRLADRWLGPLILGLG